MEDETAFAPMRFVGFRSSAIMLGRGLRLRCPNCGAKGLIVSWSKLADACPRCRLRPQRGESDYFLGGMMFNIALAEGVFVVLLVVTLAITWPRVPWTLLQFGAPVAMILAPILLYPVSRLVWLAFDLTLRPVTPNDLDTAIEAR